MAYRIVITTGLGSVEAEKALNGIGVLKAEYVGTNGPAAVFHAALKDHEDCLEMNQRWVEVFKPKLQRWFGTFRIETI